MIGLGHNPVPGPITWGMHGRAGTTRRTTMKINILLEISGDELSWTVTKNGAFLVTGLVTTNDEITMNEHLVERALANALSDLKGMNEI
jgi:hypothetical protein